MDAEGPIVRLEDIDDLGSVSVPKRSRNDPSTDLKSNATFRLKNLIFNEHVFETTAEWVTANWWAVLLMTVGFVILSGRVAFSVLFFTCGEESRSRCDTFPLFSPSY